MSKQLSPIPLLGYGEHTTPKNGNLRHASNMLHVLISLHGSKLLIFKELSAQSHGAQNSQTRQHMLQHCYLYVED
jgi:hypothetical protein